MNFSQYSHIHTLTQYLASMDVGATFRMTFQSIKVEMPVLHIGSDNRQHFCSDQGKQESVDLGNNMCL